MALLRASPWRHLALIPFDMSATMTAVTRRHGLLGSVAALVACAAVAEDLSGVHDFDFLFGDWQVHHRRLKARLAGSIEWIEFDGTQSTRPGPGGGGNGSGKALWVSAGG